MGGAATNRRTNVPTRRSARATETAYEARVSTTSEFSGLVRSSQCSAAAAPMYAGPIAFAEIVVRVTVRK